MAGWVRSNITEAFSEPLRLEIGTVGAVEMGQGTGEPNRRHKKGAREGRLFHQSGEAETTLQKDQP